MHLQTDSIIASTASNVASYAIMTVMTQMISDAAPAPAGATDRPGSPFARRVVSEAIIPIQAISRGVYGRKQAKEFRKELPPETAERDPEAVSC